MLSLPEHFDWGQSFCGHPLGRQTRQFAWHVAKQVTIKRLVPALAQKCDGITTKIKLTLGHSIILSIFSLNIIYVYCRVLPNSSFHILKIMLCPSVSFIFVVIPSHFCARAGTSLLIVTCLATCQANCLVCNPRRNPLPSWLSSCFLKFWRKEFRYL